MQGIQLMIIRLLKDLKIKNKFLIILLAVTAISLVAVVLIDYLIMENRYSRLQLYDALSNQKRILNAIDNELQHLDSTCHGWASWDETYMFMQTHDSSFIQKNLTFRSYYMNGFNMVCLLDTNNRIFFDDGFCTMSGRNQVPLIFTKSTLIKESGILELLTKGGPDMKKYGILSTELGLMMITMRPILTTKDKGPLRGYLIMGKNLDPARVKNLIRQTELNFSIIDINKKYDGTDGAPIKEIIDRNEKSVIIRDGNNIKMYLFFSDIFGKKAYIIRAFFNSSIIDEGYRTILLNIIIMVFEILLFIAIAWPIFNRFIIHPVNALAMQVESITRGEYKKIKILPNKDELGMLSKVIDNMENTISEKNNQLKSVNTQLEYLSITDGLTGIFNRRHFDVNIKSEWKRRLRNGEMLSLIICDIDFFKNYNDMYGHQAGDECLIEIANTLKRLLRRENDKIFRYGGEEFIAILPATNFTGAVQIANSFLKEISMLGIKNENSPGYGIVTMSAGVCSIIPNKNTGYNYLVELADNALYKSKSNGRNRLHSAELKENGEVVFTEYLN
jgi:diguanylate cyclase (GGDEF)-like protein